ncbi:MAG: ABC transporter substrate-binding protein, partial [Ktedonobacterales bacterium]
AINRTLLNTSIEKNSIIPHWNIVPKGMPGYNPNVTGPDGVTDPAGDTAKAQAHWATYLSTAGASAVKGWSYIYLSSSSTSKAFAEALQGMWQQALPGVTVTLKPEDFNTFLQDSNSGNYVATRFGWLDDYPDPQDFLTLLFDTHAQYNSQHASVPQADSLMEAADANSNQAQRMTNYNQAEQLLINAVATCPMFQSQQFWQVRSCVHNWTLNASATTSLDSWLATYIDNTCPNI